MQNKVKSGIRGTADKRWKKGASAPFFCSETVEKGRFIDGKLGHMEQRKHAFACG